MTEIKMRTLELVDGRRTGIRLDASTWQAIDWIANRRGIKWVSWARDVIQSHPDADNMTAVIREAALQELLSETIFAGRGDDLVAMDNNMLTKNHALLDDDGLSDFLKSSQIYGDPDFGGFAIIFGIDDSGRDFLLVRNGLRNYPHFVTVIERK